MILYYKTVAFMFGSIIGSFLNVLIYRLPLEQDVIFPRSSCPHCGSLIPFYRNIPIISFLLLRGKCGDCKGKISWVYPVVELISGIAAFLLFPDNFTILELTMFGFKFSIFSVFIVHFVIDCRHKILPDSLNLYLALVFLSYGIVYHPWIEWVVGGAIGFFFPLAITWGFYLLRGQVGLGGGDIKLYGALGLYLGIQGIVYNIFLSCLLGAVVGGAFLIITKKGRDTHIPFGPFIIVVAVAQIFFPSYFAVVVYNLLDSLVLIIPRG